MRNAAIIGGLYAAGGLVTLAILASVGPDRVRAGKSVFAGIGNPGPALQIGETFLLWPAALVATFIL